MRRLSILLPLLLLFLVLFSFFGNLANAQGPNKDSQLVNGRAISLRPTAEMLQLEDQLRADVITRMSLGLNADIGYV